MKTTFAFAILALLLVPSAVLASDFVPLTSLPGLQETAQSGNLSAFLNNLYKLCIGVAASLAVLQLIRAGVMYLGGDSITDKKQARELMVMSLFGLVLVLSPVVVFNIINPDILSLRVDVSGLVENDQTITSEQPTSESNMCAGIGNRSRLDSDAEIACCTAMTDCRVQTVQSVSGSYTECSCVSQLTPGGSLTGPTWELTGSPNTTDRFVYLATTIRPVSQGSDNNCAMLWGGTYSTSLTCQQKGASVQSQRGTETGFRVLADCIPLTQSYQVQGICFTEPRGESSFEAFGS